MRSIARRSAPAPLGSDQSVAVGHQFLNLVPVNLANIQPQRDPTSRANVSGQVKSLRIGSCQRRVVSRQHLATDGNDPVSVMIIQVVSEDPLPDPECGMSSVVLALGVRQSQTYFGYPPQA